MKEMVLIRKTGMVLTLLLLASGCAVRQAPKPMAPQEIDVLKTRLGLIGLTVARHVPRIKVQIPSKGAKEGANDGAEVGALTPIVISFEAMQGCNDPYCLLLPVAGLVLAPVGAVVGGVSGMITADSPEMVSEREVSIRDALAKLRMQENMSDQFLSRFTNLKTFPFTIIHEAGPIIEGEKPDYRQFKSNGISTINEIDVKKLKLIGRGKVRPDLYVQLEVQARLISTTDNTEIYCKVFTCSSKDDKFEVWAAQGAKKFRDEIESCYNDVADWLVNDMYVNDSIMLTQKEPDKPKRILGRRSTAKCQ